MGQVTHSQTCDSLPFFKLQDNFQTFSPMLSQISLPKFLHFSVLQKEAHLFLSNKEFDRQQLLSEAFLTNKIEEHKILTLYHKT